MKSSRPYLIRALYEWISDNRLTAHLLVDADAPGASFPRAGAKDGKIIFNVGPSAVSGLQLGNDEIAFDARFAGVSRRVVVPVGAVLAVYARENGQGMMFPPEPGPEAPAPGDAADAADRAGPDDRAHLKVIK